MNKFDSIVLGALDIAQTEALKRRNNELSPYHLLWGLVNHPKSKSSEWLSKEKVTPHLDKLAKMENSVSIQDIRTSPALSEWITLASAKTIESGRELIGEGDLLSTMNKVIKDIKIDKASVNESSEQEKAPDFLIDLNELARNGKLDPVIGRGKEIRAVIEILGRRSKNNPVLVGPAGVGKTAIVEGLAEQIVKGSVPDVLKGKTIYSLDMGGLMAGTKFRGEFEERIQALLKFIRTQSGQSILFIDEIHQLVGAGKTDGAMDAANLLKPSLARGELHCIGATTDDEFRRYILGDSALERRFRPVPVLEPTQEDAIEILLGIRNKLEMHHGIKISDEAIYSSVKLSTQYLTDKNLPDKAIDLIDESASALKLSAEAMPAELAALEAEIRSKKIQAKVEKDNKEILDEIDVLQQKFDTSKQKWEVEVSSLQKLSSVKNKIDKVSFDLDAAERRGDFEEASKIKYSVLPELEKELSELQHGWLLSSKHVAKVISRQTGIPVEKILKDKQEKLLELESYLNSRVLGQEKPLHEISQTLLTSYAGISDPNKPMGTFLLKGPTGVGKTETAKAISQFLFDSEDAVIRLDMSEYSEKHSVAKLIGSPAGYIGYDDGGILTEAVRKRPYAVVLFDEIEKAHSDFSDILLQLLDEGRLTDNKGRTVSFRNTIVFMTTNSKNIHGDFKPEVLGRLDEILEYKELSKDSIYSIITKHLNNLNERLKGKNIKITLTEKLQEYIAATGYDPTFGARPLQSVFNKIISRPLAEKIIKGEFEAKTYELDWDGQRLTGI